MPLFYYFRPLFYLGQTIFNRFNVGNYLSVNDTILRNWLQVGMFFCFIFFFFCFIWLSIYGKLTVIYNMNCWLISLSQQFSLIILAHFLFRECTSQYIFNFVKITALSFCEIFPMRQLMSIFTQSFSAKCPHFLLNWLYLQHALSQILLTLIKNLTYWCCFTCVKYSAKELSWIDLVSRNQIFT